MRLRLTLPLLLGIALASCGKDITPEPPALPDYYKEWYGDPDAACLPAGCAVTPVAVSAGFGHSCARMADGTVRCWGDNSSQQLGGSSRTQAVAELVDVVRVRAGRMQTCAISRGGTARCFGAMDTEMVGNPDVTMDGKAVTSAMPRLVNALNNSPAGLLGGLGGMACSIMATDEASVQCWGNEDTFGLGTILVVNTGIDLKILNSRFVDLSASFFNLGLTRLDGSASLCHGSNAATCLIALGDRRDIVHLAPLGSAGAFVLLRDGTVRAAGYKQTGCTSINGMLPAPDGTCIYGCDLNAALGQNCFDNQYLPQHWYPIQPTTIAGLEKVKQIEVSQLQKTDSGANAYACALHTSGTVSCWGDNSLGQLGAGSPSGTPVLQLQEVPGLHDIVQISLGRRHACALSKQQEIYCWGNNLQGQLGDTRSDGQPPTASVRFAD